MTRRIVVTCSVITLLLAVMAACRAGNEKPPVSVYAALEGHWQGSFVGYSPSGDELYRIAVSQTYTTVSDEKQAVAIEDRMPDGQVIRGTGFNIAQKTSDGRVELSCDVRKTNGDIVLHQGRLIRGPTGETEFMWFSTVENRTESFRERVVGSGAEAVYEIDGMGRYGEQMLLMAGRYRRRSD